MRTFLSDFPAKLFLTNGALEMVTFIMFMQGFAIGGTGFVIPPSGRNWTKYTSNNGASASFYHLIDCCKLCSASAPVAAVAGG